MTVTDLHSPFKIAHRTIKMPKLCVIPRNNSIPRIVLLKENKRLFLSRKSSRLLFKTILLAFVVVR